VVGGFGLTWCISPVLDQAHFGFSDRVIFESQKSQNELDPKQEKCTR
jgi:hypothetical protein